MVNEEFTAADPQLRKSETHNVHADVNWNRVNSKSQPPQIPNCTELACHDVSKNCSCGNSTWDPKQTRNLHSWRKKSRPGTSRSPSQLVQELHLWELGDVLNSTICRYHVTEGQQGGSELCEELNPPHL